MAESTNLLFRFLLRHATVLHVGLDTQGLFGLAPGGRPSMVLSLHEAMGVSSSFHHLISGDWTNEAKTGPI
jgi:hypothetical protein